MALRPWGCNQDQERVHGHTSASQIGEALAHECFSRHGWLISGLPGVCLKCSMNCMTLLLKSGVQWRDNEPNPSVSELNLCVTISNTPRNFSICLKARAIAPRYR